MTFKKLFLRCELTFAIPVMINIHESWNKLREIT
jgi:hypothetical protein